MSRGDGIAVALALAAGVGGSVQVAVMSTLGGRVGSVEALAFAALVQVAVTLTLLLVARQSVHGIAEASREPAWLWLGGVMGALIVFTVTVATPRIGAAPTVGLIISAQLVAAAVVDRFGLLGLERISLGWPRLAGLALLAAGAVLTLRR